MNFFKKDPNYLLKSFTYNTILFGLLNLLLLEFKNQAHFLFSFYSLPLIFAGLVVGLISATAFHNASHGNIKPRILNKLIGELTADFSLEDMKCFRIGHMLHHIHSDDPLLDPHPPQGLNFLQFILSSRQKTISCIENLYYKHHGKSKKSVRNVFLQIVVFHMAAVMKLIFWYLFLGPVGFTFFFIPAYLSYFFGFAHLNYISHKDETNEGNIFNHDGGWFYSLMNLITSGGYYHKNHHLSPGLYNPSKLNR